MMKHLAQPANSRGGGLTFLFVVLLLVVLVTLGLSFVDSMRGEAVLTAKIFESAAATGLAEAGIAEAMDHLLEAVNHASASPSPFRIGGASRLATWFRILRMPLRNFTMDSIVQELSPFHTSEIISLRFPGSKSKNRCLVLVSLERVRPFTGDPCPDPREIEKAAVFKLISTVILGTTTHTVEVLKEVKVVSTGLPDPLGKYTLWLGQDRGALWLPDSIPFDATGPIPPGGLNSAGEGDPDFDAMTGVTTGIGSWKYTIGGLPRTGYPFCPQKLSRLFDSWEDFMRQSGDGKNHFVDGNTMISSGGSQMSGGNLKIGGNLRGRGGLIFHRDNLLMDNLATIPGSMIHIASLEGRSVAIQGTGNQPGGGQPLKASFILPAATLSVQEGIKITGTVSAREWNFSGRRLIEYDEDNRPGGYHVSIGGQVKAWRSLN